MSYHVSRITLLAQLRRQLEPATDNF